MRLRRRGLTGLVTQDIFVQLLEDAKNLVECQGIHQRILASEHRHNWFLHNLVVHAYGRCGYAHEAKLAFDGIPQPNVFAWNSLLMAYAHCGNAREAREGFDSIPWRNIVSWTVLIQAYSREGNVRLAESAFQRIPYVGKIPCNAMLWMYAKAGELDSAKEIFDGMQDQDAATWTAMIQAYAKTSNLEKAKSCFDIMISRDLLAYNALVSAYAQHGHIQTCERIADKMPNHSIATWNSILAAFASTGNVSCLKERFDSMPDHDSVSCIIMMHVHGLYMPDMAISIFKTMPEKNATAWNTIMASHVHHGHLHGAIATFNKMPFRDSISWTAMLAAYSQAGHLDEAMDLFTAMRNRDLLSWNTIIAAHVHSKDFATALVLSRTMCIEGIVPDETTVTSLLVAFGSRGLFQGFRCWFHSIDRDYSAQQTMEHYLCAIDMLGRAGKLREAEDLLAAMPFSPSNAEWGALLGACSIHSDAMGGIRAAARAVQVDPVDSSPYVVLANTLARQLQEP